jgi:hypothetical protein
VVEFSLEVVRIVPQPLNPLRLLLQDVEGGDTGGGD